MDVLSNRSIGIKGGEARAVEQVLYRKVKYHNKENNYFGREDYCFDEKNICVNENIFIEENNNSNDILKARSGLVWV